MKERTNTELNLDFLKNNAGLEDEIYLQLDKVQALCTTQIVLHSSEIQTTNSVRIYHSIVVEEQVAQLRSLVDQLFV